MKKLFLIPLAFAALASCSQHEVVDNGATTGETVTSYLAVNLVASNGGTRAGGDDYGQFEEGTQDENNVSSVRFYFFKSTGDAVSVYEGQSKNAYDVEMSDGGKDMNNVEKILSAVLVLNTENATEEGDTTEGVASIVAIVNPDEVDGLTTNMSLSDLEGVIKDLTPDTDDDFVMSNSVYADGGAKVKAVSITSNIFSTAAAAEANPVTIFVERVVAKVRVTIDETMTPETGIGDNVYSLKEDEEVPVEVEGEPEPEGQEPQIEQKKVYVKLLGWNVTAKAATSRLIKEINASWSEQLFTSDYTQPWTDPTWHRSYWAANPETMTYVYGKFGSWDDTEEDVEFEGTDAGAIEYFDDNDDHVNYVYVQENAALYANLNTTGKEWSDEGVKETDKTADNTKVIVAAQLVDEDGEPLEFAEYAFNRYTVADLKDFLAASAKLYDEDGTALSADDIEFKTVWTVEKGEAEVDHTVSGRYNVYAQLTETAGQKTWYDTATLDGETDEEHEVATPNTTLKNLGKVKVWTNGYTYYTVKIAHIAGVQTEPTGTAGLYGVVRNHIYAVNIKSISGLGTPVFDPEEDIIPEDPEDEFSFCAAEIRILSWRIVSQDVDLTW